MAFQGLTPESLLDRSDSKNPATTCKGLTANGRSCRRGLGSAPGSSPNNTPTRRSSSNNNAQLNYVDEAGVVAIIDSTNAAAFFCWQHKDQAQNLIARIESQQSQQQQKSQQQATLQRQRTRIIPLQKRSSIDTLIEKVGIIDLDGYVSGRRDEAKKGRLQSRSNPRPRPDHVRVRKRETLPLEWQDIQGPLMSVPEEVVNEVAPDLRIYRRHSRSRSGTRLNTRESRKDKFEYPSEKVRPRQKASWSCCGLAADEYNDDGPPARRRERYNEKRPSRSRSRPRPSLNASRPISYTTQAASRPVSQPAMQEQPQHLSEIYTSGPGPRQQARPHPGAESRFTPVRQRRIPMPDQLNTNPLTPSSNSPPHTQTSHFLSLIPPHLDPTTTSALLTELSRPFAKDDDAGYIYIYWLTPSTTSSANNATTTNIAEDKPDDDIASTILDSDSDSDDSYRPITSTRHRRPSQHYTNPASPSSNNRKQTKQALLTRYASIKHQPSTSTSTPSASPKILLKIGRATNVHRRMTQWSKQCNQNITLIRYYPYKPSYNAHLPSQNDKSPETHDGKVPHVNKVERLIHIELRGLGMGYDSQGRKCEVCGRGHREWFEVESSRNGLKEVDGIVGRWIGWGLRSEQ